LNILKYRNIYTANRNELYEINNFLESIGDGWVNLVEKLSEDISKELENKNSNFKICGMKNIKNNMIYIKRKYSTKEIENIIHHFEIYTMHTCNICGNEGKYQKNKNNEFMVICDSCRLKDKKTTWLKYILNFIKGFLK